MREFKTLGGTKVKEGDYLYAIITTPFGYVPVGTVKLNEKSIPKLLKKGMIKEALPPRKVPTDITFYVKRLAQRIKWKEDNLVRYLNNLNTIYPVAIVSIILREIALYLDEKYPDHINNSNEIWYISAINGEIERIHDVTKVKNFRNFAAFRSLEDAKIAKEIMRVPLGQLFKRGGK